jgi:hypothetical protein
MYNIKYILVLTLMVSSWSLGFDVDTSLPEGVPSPALYMPFENTNGMYGPGTGDNPAWINYAYPNDLAEVLDRGGDEGLTENWLKTRGFGGGVKGNYMDGSSLDAYGEYCRIVTFRGADAATAMSGLDSFTVSFWLRTTAPVTATNYLFQVPPYQMYLATNGRIGIHYWTGLDWKASPNDAYDIGPNGWTGEWVFVAVAIGDNGAKFYAGSPTEAPQLVGEVVVENLGKSRDGLTDFYFGYRSYVAAVYQNFDMDELRMWASKTDETADLNLDQITSIWAFDYDPSPAMCGDADHVMPEGDLDADCVVNLSDFAVLCSNWLTNTRP